MVRRRPPASPQSLGSLQAKFSGEPCPGMWRTRTYHEQPVWLYQGQTMPVRLFVRARTSYNPVPPTTSLQPSWKWPRESLLRGGKRVAAVTANCQGWQSPEPITVWYPLSRPRCWGTSFCSPSWKSGKGSSASRHSCHSLFMQTTVPLKLFGENSLMRENIFAFPRANWRKLIKAQTKKGFFKKNSMKLFNS